MSEVFDVRQELPGFEAVPGNVPEISEETRQTLARVILDETVEIVANNRRAQVRYDGLDGGEFAELFRPLVDVLALDPAVDRPPLRVSIDRASKLGMVPSQKAIYDRTTLSKIQSHLGFRPKFRFQDWMKADYVAAGKRLAQIVGGRPTRFDIQGAGKGEFRPGFIQNTFESAANPGVRGGAIEASLASQGWTMQNEESLQTFITKAMNKREREVADLQAAALSCGEKKYCLEDKEDKLTALNDKPLAVNVYLAKTPYKLYLEYELYPTDETAKLEAKLQYGCSEPNDEYCRR